MRQGKLSAGHARLLVGQPNAEELADEIVDQGLNVRQVEARCARTAAAGARHQARVVKPVRQPAKDADTRALEKRLSDALGLSDRRSRGGGTLHIKYTDLDQLDAVLRKLGG